MTSPVTVFAALGPNPAPLAELVWRLGRDGVVVTDAFVVVDARGLHYLQRELPPVLDELRALFGHHTALHHTLVAAPDGVVLDDDDPDHAARYNDAIWTVARAAIAHAGDDDVVFGLCAGRRRTMTAMTSMAFQLLARAHDRCVDVRVTDCRAEGGSGFYFPEQRAQQLVSRDGERFVAADVDIRIVDVQLPRLRGLLTTDALGSYDEALRVGQARVDEVAVPHLTIDLQSGTLTIDNDVVKMSASNVMWIAALAVARLDDAEGAGWVSSSSVKQLRRVLAGSSWKKKPLQTKVLKYLLGEEADAYDGVDDPDFLVDLGVREGQQSAAHVVHGPPRRHRPLVSHRARCVGHRREDVASTPAAATGPHPAAGTAFAVRLRVHLDRAACGEVLFRNGAHT